MKLNCTLKTLFSPMRCLTSIRIALAEDYKLPPAVSRLVVFCSYFGEPSRYPFFHGGLVLV
jgi:hypothetical protein